VHGAASQSRERAPARLTIKQEIQIMPLPDMTHDRAYEELPEFDDDDVLPVASAYGKEPSRWAKLQASARLSSGAASGAISATEHFLHTKGAIALMTTGAAVSATGIGLLATGAVGTATTMAFSARSCYRTHGHIRELEAIAVGMRHVDCKKLDPASAADRADQSDQAEHLAVLDALHYVIRKKTAKRAKKAVGMLALSAPVTVYGLGKALWKRCRNTKGKNRMAHATNIAQHLVTHDCALAQAIVTELYSFDEMNWLRLQPSDVVAGFLAHKMKST
jgi:hypothetical protein